MTPVAILIHANPVVHDRYRIALGCRVIAVNSTTSQLSAGYDERSGIARDCPTIPALLRRYARDVPTGTPVVLVAFSAGCWLLRALLRDPDSRLQTIAAVALDGLHAGDTVPLAGVLDHARMAIVDPVRRACVVTHTQIVPPYASTRDTADRILGQLGLGRLSLVEDVHAGGFHLRAYPGADGPAHSRQLQVVGPQVCEEYVAPLVRAARDAVAPTEPVLVRPDLPLGERALAWTREEMRRQARPSAARRAEYFAECVREQGATLRRLGLRDGNWCAAGACYATRQVAQDGDHVPHLYRASGLELERDAVRAGAWLPVSRVREGGAVPAPGDLVILHRGKPETWPTAWERHVARVAEWPGGDTFVCLDANGSGGHWREVQRSLGHPALRENAKEIEADKAALALRIEKMQENFLNAEQALLQRLDDEREARLKQALQHATALSDTTQRILEAAEQMRLSSRSPTTGTKS